MWLLHQRYLDVFDCIVKTTAKSLQRKTHRDLDLASMSMWCTCPYFASYRTCDASPASQRLNMAIGIPTSIQTAPLLKQWVQLLADGRFQIYSGEVELGQGISAALVKVACEQLCIHPEQNRLIPQTHSIKL